MTTRYGSGFRPALSPDGKWLVYGTRFETKTGLRLRDLETQAGGVARLPGPARRHRVARAAGRVSGLLVHARFAGRRRLVRRRDLARAGRQGRAGEDPVRGGSEARDRTRGEVRVRVDTAATFTARQIRDLAPSPDGKQLAFSALDRLYVVDLPNGTPQRGRLTGEIGEFNPVWSPDWQVARVRDVERRALAASCAPHRCDAAARGRASALARRRGLYSDLAWSPSGTASSPPAQLRASCRKRAVRSSVPRPPSSSGCRRRRCDDARSCPRADMGNAALHHRLRAHLRVQRRMACSRSAGTAPTSSRISR